MAPIKPSHRTSRPAKSILKSSATASSAKTSKSKIDSLFPTTKEDKRRIKHANLMFKVSKATESKNRRRRPNKKLVTTLDSLTDALPTTGDDADENTATGNRPEEQVHIIRRTATKSKPGALKRKQKLDNQERERFAKNLAQMNSSSTTAGGAASTTASRWAALRGFIGQTLERRPDAVAGKG